MAAPGPTGVHTPRSWREIFSRAARIQFVVLAALMVFVYWSALRHTLAARWLSDGNWSHGWLIPLFSLYFLSTRREELLSAPVKPNYLGAVILAFSLWVYFVSAWWLRMAYPQALSIVFAIFGLTLLMGGWSVMRVAAFPILFLVLAVPLPQSVYVELTIPLRRLASYLGALMMPLFAPGLYTEAQALVIDFVWPGVSQGTLNVDEACSGMRLLMAIVTLGVAMAYLGERPLWDRVVMVIACIPIAVFCNTIRVTVTGLFTVYGREELARGTPHQLLGILMLAVALGLFSLIGYVLSHLFVEETDGDRP